MGATETQGEEHMKLEDYGYCSKTGKCINPFGIKPEWVQKLAAKIRLGLLIDQTEDAPF